MAAKYIFGSSQLPDMVSKLSGTTKNLTSGLVTDPQKIENIISMVRTVAPLTSTQTVTKVNTYLPLFEKASTLLGMYSFLNRAQTFRPIEPLNTKSPVDMMTTLMKNGNVPVGKMLAQPLIANNMEKMMGNMAMNMFKNGNINDLLNNGNINDLLKNKNITDMLSSFTNKQPSDNNSPNSNSNIDLGSLMDTFMPILSSMSTNDEELDRNYVDNFEKTPNKLEFINETVLPDDEPEDSDNQESYEEFTYDDQYEKYDRNKNDKYNRNYRHDKYDNNEKNLNYNNNNNNDTNDNNNNNNSNYSKDLQKPIRIKHRKRRY